MRKGVRLAGLGAVALMGAGTAVATAAGEDGIRACAVKKTGEIRSSGPNGKCSASQLPITISGGSLKSSKSGTLTINGVAFKGSSRGQTLTINGTSFKSNGKTLTLSGNTFRTGTLPRTLTINGVSFQTGTLPKSLTINGVAFTGTLPTSVTGAAGPAGPQGAAGARGAEGTRGPTGPAGTGDPRPLPGTVAARQVGIAAAGGQPTPGEVILTDSVTFTDGPHKLLLTGGFTAACNPCSSETLARYAVTRRTDTDPVGVVARVLPPFLRGSQGSGAINEQSGSLNEAVLSPEVCSPCTFELRVAATATGSGSPLGTLDVLNTNFAVVDLGRVG